MGTQINDIIGKYNAIKAQEVAESKALKEKAENALQAALHYQSIAAKKMTIYHKLEHESWAAERTRWTSVVKEVCEEIERRAGVKFRELDNLHVLGLRGCCTVFAYDGDKSAGYLSFTCRGIDNFRLYVDTKEKKQGKFPAGSIGDLNGFDNISVEVESIEQLIDIMRKNCD